MRKLVPFVVVVLAGCFVFQGLAQDNGKGEKKQAPYMHVVIFYLKKDAPKDAAKGLIEDGHKLLAKIPVVRQLWIGRPAKDATPKLAAMDYDVALTIAFDNAEGLKTYIDHDLHTQYVKNHGPHIEKVLVYDFQTQEK